MKGHTGGCGAGSVKTGIGGSHGWELLPLGGHTPGGAPGVPGTLREGLKVLFTVCTLVSPAWTALCLPLSERRPALPPAQSLNIVGPVLAWPPGCALSICVGGGPDLLKIQDIHQKPTGGMPSCTHLPSVTMELLHKADLTLLQERRTEAVLSGHNCGQSLKEK